MNAKIVEMLPITFIGTGEVKDFVFAQIGFTEWAYCYKVEGDEGNIHYEVFRRKNSPMCIDFEKRIYSDCKFKESYPKANSFGDWAWTFKDEYEAYSKMKMIKAIIKNDE